MQSEITGRIANTLNLTMIRAEADRPTARPDALDYILRARAILVTNAEARRLFERALELDPLSVEAQSQLAARLLGTVLDDMTDTRDADIARAEALIAQALATSPQSKRIHAPEKRPVIGARRRKSAPSWTPSAMNSFEISC